MPFELLGVDVSLPLGWLKARDNDKLYCFNPATKQLSHELPPKYLLVENNPLMGKGWHSACILAEPKKVFYFKGEQKTWNLKDTVPHQRLRLSSFEYID